MLPQMLAEARDDSNISGDNGYREQADATGLFRIDLQVDGHLLAIIELADRLAVALAALELSVHLVVDIRRQCRKPEGSVRSDNIRLYRAVPRVRQVDHRVGQGIVAVIEYFPCKESSWSTFLRGSRQSCEGDNQKRQYNHPQFFYQGFLPKHFQTHKLLHLL